MTDTNGKPGPSVGELKQHILHSIDVRSFYNRYLRRNQTLPSEGGDGWTERVLCPVHDDQNTPSFFVNIKTGYFKCQACGKYGSVFDFWLLMHGMSADDKKNFKEAIKGVASECGIDISAFLKSYTPAARPPETAQKPPEEQPIIPDKNQADIHDAANAAIPNEYVESLQKALRPDHFKYLATRGLKKRTIEQAKLGWDEKSAYKDKETDTFLHGRYAIPVFNRKGECRNVRLYTNRAEKQFKMINYVKDKKTDHEVHYGRPARLYNLHRLTDKIDNIVFCEGEWDTLLLQQHFEDAGLETWLAVTSTHGVNKFQAEWLEYFKDKNIYLCVDCDEEGKAGAINLASKYLLPGMKRNFFKSVRIVTLPLSGEKDMKDIGDYFLKAGYTCDDFLKLVTDTPEVTVGGIESDEATAEAIDVDDFTTAIKDRRYIDKRIRVPITIFGESSCIYHAIREYKVSKCPKGDECCCYGAGAQIIPYGDQLFIESCMNAEGAILRRIAERTCQLDQDRVKVRPLKKVVMEQYFAHQVVQRWRAEEDANGVLQNTQKLTQAEVYYLQPPDKKHIEPQNYLATGFIRTHPRKSIATFFIEHMEEMEEDWRKFTVESQDNFQTIDMLKKDFTIDQITSDLTNGVTNIYESDDILYGVLMMFLSPRRFYFNGRLQRGWINGAIIGDSGTGKSATYARISDWMGLGDLFSCMSGTRTGLLYAIKKSKNDEWMVQIGRYVQASGKAIFIDEADKAERDDIRKMSVAMQDGWLDIAQVAQGGYHTETRMLLALNPVKNGQAATVSDFLHGCDSLGECFDPMFIRRLDFAVFTTGRKKYDFYNQLSTGNEKKNIRLTPKMLRSLVYWAWTRKPEQIVWGQQSTELCLAKATELSKVYGDVDKVPLVNPNDFREKLARLTVAYAVLDRNFSDDNENVIIDVRHVNAAASYIDLIYSASSCNLRQKSKQARLRNTMEDFEKILAAFERAIAMGKNGDTDDNMFCQMLLLFQQLTVVRKRDLADQLAVNPKWIQNRMAILQGLNLAVSARGGYQTTRKFNLFMQQWAQDPQVERMLETVHKQIGEKALNTTVSQSFEYESDSGPYEYDESEAPPSSGVNRGIRYHNDPFSE